MSTAVTSQRSMEAKLEAAIDRQAVGSMDLSARGGLVFKTVGEAMEFAKLMSLGREGIPKHLRENPGICLAVTVQALELGMSPMALANKSYVVNDRLCYEAAMYQTIVARRAPIKGRIKMEYAGDGDKRTCRVWAELADGSGTVEYTSPPFGRINPKNSPLWKNDPDQQLFYFSARSFARRHFPDVIMGVYTVDEMLDTTAEVVRTVDSRPKTERVASRLLESVAPTTEVQQEETQQPEATETSRQHEPYAAILARINAAPNGQQAADISKDINTAVESGELTSDEATELQSKLSAAMN